jgi:hypothetical protein
VSGKKHKIQASDVEVGNRSLEAVLIDLAERAKDNDAKATIALQTIAAVSQDLRAITQELRDANKRTDTRLERTDARLDALEKAG